MLLRRTEKGQIASLDFILSLILLTLAIGLIFRFTEIHSYYLKGEELDLTLVKMGRAASEILLHSQDTTCSVSSVSSGSEIYVLPNCLDKAKIAALTGGGTLNSSLGIPATHNLYIALRDVGGTLDSEFGLAPINPSDITRIFSEERTIVVLDDSTAFTKSLFQDCLDASPTCQFTQVTATITVWSDN